MYLKLVRPLVSLDVETHAKVTPEQAHICEIGFHIEYPDGRPPKVEGGLIRPPVAIAPDATEVHHITNEDVAQSPLFKDVAMNLARWFSDCDFAGYNVKFDLRVIAAEMARAGVKWSYEKAFLVDGLRLWQVKRPRTLSDAVREFLAREPAEAHRALGDAEDALAVALALAERFDLPTSVAELHELCFAKDPGFVDQSGKIVWANGQAVINFGKHKGVALQVMSRNYLEWMLGSDFPEDTKTIIRGALNGQAPVPK